MFGKKKEPKSEYYYYYRGTNIIAINLSKDDSYRKLDELIGLGFKVISGTSINSGYFANPGQIIILQKA